MRNVSKIELTQADGSKLTLNQIPTNIISLVPSVTENMILFGKPPMARTSFCIEPKDKVKDIPVIGGTKTPRISKIIDMKPDLVIANQEENIQEHVEEIRRAGIPVWVTFQNKVAQLPSFMRELSSVCDDSASVSQWLDKSEKLLQQNFQWLQRPKIIALIWKKPWMAVGQDTYASDLIRFCGGDNPVPGRYPEITVDDVKKFKPDIMILPTEPYEFKNDDLKFWQEVVPKVLFFSGEDLLWSGPRWVKATMDLVEICKSFQEKKL